MQHIDFDSSDLRTRKTNMAIFEALAELLTKKQLHEITVTELCQAASINRKTFYMHFSSVKEAFDYISIYIARRFKQIQKKYYTAESYDVLGFVSESISSVNSRRQFYRNLAKSSESSKLMSDCIELAVNIRMAFLTHSESIDTETVRRVQQFFNAGYIAVIFDWLKSTNPIPAKQLIKFCTDIFINMRKQYPIDTIAGS